MKTYFDPHPGLAGALARLPEPVRLRANDMAGRSLDDETALAMLQEVLPPGYSLENVEHSAQLIPLNRYASGDGMLVVKSSAGYPRHEWCAIKWRWTTPPDGETA